MPDFMIAQLGIGALLVIMSLLVNRFFPYSYHITNIWLILIAVVSCIPGIGLIVPFIWAVFVIVVFVNRCNEYETPTSFEKWCRTAPFSRDQRGIM